MKRMIFFFFWLYQVLTAVCGLWFPEQGWNPGPLHWELEVLATGPPGNLRNVFLFGFSKVEEGRVKG